MVAAAVWGRQWQTQILEDMWMEREYVSICYQFPVRLCVTVTLPLARQMPG